MYLNVLSRPSTPVGPLEVERDTAQRFKLRWGAPKDGGGCPIKYYSVDLLCPFTSGNTEWKRV